MSHPHEKKKHISRSRDDAEAAIARQYQSFAESAEAALIQHGFIRHPLKPQPSFQEALISVQRDNRRAQQLLCDEYHSIDQHYRAETKRHPGQLISSPEFRQKNRYRNILPFEESAVKLKGIEGNPESKYINANFISDKLILTQGPITETISDFWSMVLETEMTTIVMLTTLYDSEEGKDKCAKYWCDEGIIKYSAITVELKSAVFCEPDALTLRIFEVSKGTKRMFVKHIQYEGWPDHGVPASCSPIMRVLLLSMEYKNAASEKLPSSIVHCSAGVGRSGAFALVYHAICQLYDLPKQGDGKVESGLAARTGKFSLHPAQVLHHLRQKRMMTIQSPEQYFFSCYFLGVALEYICRES